MGERGNIIILQHGGADCTPLYFYTHWDGWKLPSILQAALQRREHWDDEPYLARIIFSTMIANDVDGGTGYGISTYITDNSYPLLVVDCECQRVACVGALNEIPSSIADDTGWSFEEFCGLSLDQDNPFAGVTD